MHYIFVYFVRGSFCTKIKCTLKDQSKSEKPQQSASERKFHAYERSEVATMRKFSAYKIFWIYSNLTSLQTLHLSMYLIHRYQRSSRHSRLSISWFWNLRACERKIPEPSVSRESLQHRVLPGRPSAILHSHQGKISEKLEPDTGSSFYPSFGTEENLAQMLYAGW